MKRPLRLLLVVAPLLLLLIGVPLGVSLSQRAAPRSVPQDPTGSMRINVAATPTYAPVVGVRQLKGTPAPISNAQTGLIGTVTSLGPDRFTVLTRARRRAVILVGPDAIIRFQNKNVALAALRVGDEVTVLGRRDAANGFHAILIRIVRPDSTVTPTDKPR